MSFCVETSGSIKFNSFDNKSSQIIKPKENTIDVNNSSVTTKYYDISGKDFLEHIEKLKAIETDLSLIPEHADKPNMQALGLAWVIIRQLWKVEVPPTKVVASAEGGVAVYFVAGQKYADIECLNSGEILGVTTNRRDRPNVWEIEPSSSEIARAIERVREFLNTRST